MNLGYCWFANRTIERHCQSIILPPDPSDDGCPLIDFFLPACHNQQKTAFLFVRARLLWFANDESSAAKV